MIFFSKPSKRKCIKTDVYHTDDIWSLDTLVLKHCGTENKRRYRYVLVVIDNFSKYGWTVPLKKMLKREKTHSKILLYFPRDNQI